MAMEAEARALLQRAMALHSRGDIDEALGSAREAIARDAGYGEAYAYLGNTLVTRKRRFADGLAALERAVELRPDDATTWYTLGWCREFVANALARPKGAHQSVAQDADAIYASAREAMLHALTLEPDDALRGDIEDILEVIERATGMRWGDDDAPAVRRVPS